MVDHECEMKDDIKDVNTSVKELSSTLVGLSTDVALITRDITDLKSATISMSSCIRTLTEASIITQQTSVTRDKFYEKLEEMATQRIQALAEANARIDLAKREMDLRMIVMEQNTALLGKNLITISSITEQFVDLKRWVMGISASLIIFAAIEVYKIIVTKNV